MDTNKLRELLGAASEGPWVAQDTEYSVVICDQDGGSLAAVWPESLLGKKHDKAANAALIVALRNNAEALLARLEAAEKMRDAMDKINERAANWHVGFGSKENRRWIYELSGEALAAYDKEK